MSDMEALLEELHGLDRIRSSHPDDVTALLTRAKAAAGRWADVLEEIQESAHGLLGPHAEAALEVAFRHAEDSYVELEIALAATRDAHVIHPTKTTGPSAQNLPSSTTAL
ncbi:hypothetical protein PUR61_17355 [Streptomyces sp. BE20]|uniref:hypothetical protein n=1 Tax=Streptomyces sp. BE20 TaxID=3002525 RepID=UPI002E76EF05|nr:hypothetical protein [Streptomyces sp. BE20]MEE1823944.1 hypothetical protein [Streptomyces sp. BE20]